MSDFSPTPDLVQRKALSNLTPHWTDTRATECLLIRTSFLLVWLQWVEESFTNFEKGINWRSYVVCDVAYNNVNNWLWTPFVERGTANRIYIEIKFTIRDCSLFPGNALSCKETFSLLYYEFDAATREPPPWEPESYKLIGKSKLRYVKWACLLMSVDWTA